MEEYEVSKLVKRVRNVIDQNMESDNMASFGDVDTLSLDEVIKENLVPAAQLIETSAPHDKLGAGVTMTTQDAFSKDTTLTSGKYKPGGMKLPEDYLRLVCFKMPDWRTTVTEPIDDTHPMYAMQRSVVDAVRGNPQKPVVAVINGSKGQMLEAYSSEKDNVDTAKYIPKPSIAGGKIKLCPLLVDAIVYATAYLVANSYNAITQAQIFLSTARSLAGIQSAQQPTNTEE